MRKKRKKKKPLLDERIAGRKIGIWKGHVVHGFFMGFQGVVRLYDQSLDRVVILHGPYVLYSVYKMYTKWILLVQTAISQCIRQATENQNQTLKVKK